MLVELGDEFLHKVLSLLGQPLQPCLAFGRLFFLVEGSEELEHAFSLFVEELSDEERHAERPHFDGEFEIGSAE